MKNTKYAIAFAIGCLLLQFGRAQQKEWCGTMSNLQRAMQSDSSVAKRYQQFIDYSQNLEKQSIERGVDTNYTPLIIPIVFHIVSQTGTPIGTGANITDEQVLSQIPILNANYNYAGQPEPLIPDVFKPLVANCQVKFCVAQFDPYGNVTTGIERNTFPVPTWNTEGEIDSILKPATRWDTSYYLNIWTVDMGGSLLSEGLLGYSSIPYVTDPSADGVVVRYDVIGNTGNLLPGSEGGKTPTHEVGHWLGLFHTFGNNDGTCGTDYIADTPPEAYANYNCPSWPHISCDNGPDGDIFVDFMDYTNDGCGGMFTIDQAQRMHNILDDYRPEMKTALTECYLDYDAAITQLEMPATDTICTLTFTPVVTLGNLGINSLTAGTFLYQLDGGTALTINWSGSLSTSSTERILLPEQTVTPGRHTITIIFNAQPDDNNLSNDTLTNTFYAYDGGTADSLPFTQNFEGTFPGDGWGILDPANGAITWKIDSSFSAYGQAGSCIFMNNLAYTVNSQGIKEDIVSPGYDFTSITYPELKFDEAYTPLTEERSDSLNIYYSLNCSSNWTFLWGENGPALATAPYQNTLFTPTDSEWRTIKVPLWPLVGLQKASFKFENVSGWGNAMYLDNISVVNDPAIATAVTEVSKPQAQVKVFPNPASNLLAIKLPYENAFKQVDLINAVGQTVYTSTIEQTSFIFPVSNFPSGLYLVRLSGNSNTQVQKVLIMH